MFTFPQIKNWHSMYRISTVVFLFLVVFAGVLASIGTDISWLNVVIFLGVVMFLGIRFCSKQQVMKQQESNEQEDKNDLEGTLRSGKWIRLKPLIALILVMVSFALIDIVLHSMHKPKATNDFEFSGPLVVCVIVFILLILASAFTMLPGFVFQLFGRKTTGKRLIAFGAFCGAIAFSSALPVIAWQKQSLVPLIMLVIICLIPFEKLFIKADSTPKCN